MIGHFCAWNFGTAIVGTEISFIMSSAGRKLLGVEVEMLKRFRRKTEFLHMYFSSSGYIPRRTQGVSAAVSGCFAA
jgi:hypothetical protein